MARQYFNRYEDFIISDKYKIVPGIKIPIKNSDKFIQYKKNNDRLDKISEQFYGSPLFGWLILTANPSVPSNEFDINDNTLIRIPYPLENTLQDYKQQIDDYIRYYG